MLIYQETIKQSKFDDVLGDGEECDVGQFGKRRHSISQQDYDPADHYDNHIEPVPLFLEMQGPGECLDSVDQFKTGPEYTRVGVYGKCML